MPPCFLQGPRNSNWHRKWFFLKATQESAVSSLWHAADDKVVGLKLTSCHLPSSHQFITFPWQNRSPITASPEGHLLLGTDIACAKCVTALTMCNSVRSSFRARQKGVRRADPIAPEVWLVGFLAGLVATWCSSEQLAPGCQILLPQVLTSTTLVKANPRESKMSKMSKPVVLQKQVKESTSAPAGNSPTGLLMADSALGKFRLEGRCWSAAASTLGTRGYHWNAASSSSDELYDLTDKLGKVCLPFFTLPLLEQLVDQNNHDWNSADKVSQQVPQVEVCQSQCMGMAKFLLGNPKSIAPSASLKDSILQTGGSIRS